MSDPFVSLPGSTGRYMSSADINLLDADTAHTYQSVGQWLAQANVNTPAVRDASGVYGGRAGFTSLIANNSGAATTRVAIASIPVLTLTEYSLSVLIRRAPGATLDAWKYVARLENSGGTNELSVNSNVVNLSETFQLLTATFTTLATTETIELRMQSDDANGLAADELEWGQACLRLGADATFVPSVRIVGDIDMRCLFSFSTTN